MFTFVPNDGTKYAATLVLKISLIVPELCGGELERSGDVEGDVEHPEEGGEVEVVHDEGEGEAALPTQLRAQHVRQETAVRA